MLKKKRSKVKESKLAEQNIGKQHIDGQNIGESLDLHSLDPDGVVLHQGLSYLEVSDPSDLLSLMSDSRIRPFILTKLSSTQAVVLPQHYKQLTDALRKSGHTPKVSRGLHVNPRRNP